MFLHIATNIKDMDKVKIQFKNENNVNMDDYKKEIYNLSDILVADTKTKEELLNKMYKSLLIGRANNVLVVLFFDKAEDIKIIDKNGIVRSNCFILEENN